MFNLSERKLTEKELNEYRKDRAYGCFTRNCLELEIWPAVANSVRFVVFCDIDQMHQANDRFGYAGVDKKIKAAINTGRQTDIAVARWYSGDELVFLVLEGPRSGNPLQFCERIQSRLARAGLSATFGVVEIRPKETLSPKSSVRRAMTLVQRAKEDGQRASIHAEKKLASAFGQPAQPVKEVGWLGRIAASLAALVW
jgi:GGDEF domain-containing protein